MEYPRQTNNLIADLRGLPPDRSVAKFRPAFDLGTLIEVLEQKYKLGQEKIEDTIARHWKDIVGEHAAHRSSPQRVVSGAILLIQVANPSLRSEIQFQKEKILARIHRLPGGGVIKEITLRHG